MWSRRTRRTYPIHESIGKIIMNFDRIPLSRRNLLKYTAVGAIAGGTLSSTACSSNKPKEVGIVNADGKRILPWSNWSGNQNCQPSDRIVPRNEDELLTLLRSGNQKFVCLDLVTASMAW